MAPHIPRLDAIATTLGTTAQTIDVLSDGLRTPFLEPICVAVRSIVGGVQNIRTNKNQCTLLLEAVNQLLYAVIALHLKCDPGTLRPAQLAEMGRAVEILHSVFTLLETQRESSRIKRFFKLGDDAAMFKNCQTEIQNIVHALKMQNIGLVEAIEEVNSDLDRAHDKILELVDKNSDAASFSTNAFSASFGAGSSASIFSLIPPSPQIFHGRETELAHIINTFTINPNPSIVILGPGGIGKTSVARAALHHPNIRAKYPTGCCVYASCDTALNAQNVLLAVATHLGLKPGRNPRADIAAYMKDKPAHLLVLDNLERIWEPMEFRREVEGILAFFAAIDNVALLVTMRGAERPAEVPWTRPFLPPLDPLAHDAARRTLLDIADEPVEESQIREVLALTDNIPLAITLVAHLLESEGAVSVLSRWEQYKTTLLSDGFDKRTNLDMSIAVSLASPRMCANSAAQELLSILSVLPDGLGETDLQQSTIPIPNLLESKTTLLRTSLAYISRTKRLNLLVPIREYMRAHHPPPIDLLRPLFQSYTDVLGLFDHYHGMVPIGNLRARIVGNFANIQTLLAFRMQGDVSAADATEIVLCGCVANEYSHFEGHGEIAFVGDAVAQSQKLFGRGEGSELLEVKFICQQLAAYALKSIPDAPELIQRAISMFPRFDDAKLKCRVYIRASLLAEFVQSDLELAETWAQKAIALSEPTSRPRASSLRRLAHIHWRRGDLRATVKVAEIAQSVSRQCAHLAGEGDALSTAAMALCEMGEYTRAGDAAVQARTIFSLCEVRGGEDDMALLHCIGEVHHSKSEYADAKAAFHEILRSAPVESRGGMHLVVLLNLADIEIALDEPEKARTHLDAASEIATKIGWKLGSVMCSTIEGALLLHHGDFDGATEHLQRTFLLNGGPAVQTFCVERLADPNLWSTESYSSKWPYILLAHLCRGTGQQQKTSLLKALQFLGCTMLMDGDTASASVLLSVALEEFTTLDIHRSVAECSLTMAEIFDGQAALDLLDRAHRGFELSAQVKGMARVEERIKELELRTAVASSL